MRKHKSDLVPGKEFTKINMPPKKHHYPLPSEVIPEDENANQLKETLIGMEYDIESNEDITGEEALKKEEEEFDES